MADQPAVTPYGIRSPAAPKQLDLFGFLVGKWDGVGKARLKDGKYAQFKLQWIGRYVLDGTAIEDEIHSAAPDGSPYLGISLRSYDRHNGSWIIEYVNVSGSFVRKQVNARTGSVRAQAGEVVVTAQDGQTISREVYRTVGTDRFTYTIDTSNDGGKTWDSGSIQMSMTRAP